MRSEEAEEAHVFGKTLYRHLLRQRMRASCILSVLTSTFVVSACVKDLDTTPPPARTVSLGEKIYLELCNRIASGEDPGDVAGIRSRPVCELGLAPGATAGPKLKALYRYRASLIHALNDAIPAEITTDANTLVTSLLPLYDQGIMQPTTRAAAALLAELAADPQSIAGMARMSQREGYRPPAMAPGLIQPLLRYPQLQAFTRVLMNTVGEGSGGKPIFDQLLLATQHTLRNSDDLLLDPADPQHLYLDARDMVLSENAAHSDGTDRWVIRRDHRGMAMVHTINNQIPFPFSDRNRDGFADINDAGQFIDAQGAPIRVPAPFPVTGIVADADIPSIADTTNVTDVAHLTSNSQPSQTVIPERRDSNGLLLSPTGLPVYEYINVSQTLLAGLMLETRELVKQHPGILIDSIAPIQLLLGTPSAQTYTFANGEQMHFNGYDVDRSPLLDLMHAAHFMLDKPFFPPAVAAQSEIVSTQEVPLAEMVDLFNKVSDWLDEPAFANAELAKNNILLDELLALLIEIANEDSTSIHAGQTYTLLGRLIEAFKDDHVQALGPLFAKQMRYRDYVNYNPANINGPPIGSLSTPVDRNRPDVFDNRSVFQRFLHLVHDTNGAKMCNKDHAVVSTASLRSKAPAICNAVPVMCDIPLFGTDRNGDGRVDRDTEGYAPCALFQIDNMAIFYLESIVGQATMTFKDQTLERLTNLPGLLGLNQDLLEVLSEIDGFRKHPTAPALNRLIFAPRNEAIRELIDAPLGIDGASLESRHPGTIFAWELGGFYDNIRPLAQAFVDHGRADLLADMMSILHRHWPSIHNDTTQNIDPNLPAYSHKSGAVQFEELLARTMDEGRMMQANRDLLAAAAFVQVPDHTGTMVSGQDVIVQMLQYLLKPDPIIAFRNGGMIYTRADGHPVAGPMAPAHLLVQALRDADNALDRSIPLRKAFTDSLTYARKQFLPVTHDIDGTHFANRRAYLATQAVTAFAAKQIQRHVTVGDLSTWARDLPNDTRDKLRHPITASLVQLLDLANNNDPLQQNIDQMVLYMLDNTSAASPFGMTVSNVVDQLQALADITSLKPFIHHMAGAFTLNEGLIDSSLRMMQHVDPLDPHGILPRLLSNVVTVVHHGSVLDQSQPIPLQVFADVITAVQRTQPGPTSPLTSADAKAICTSVGDFLIDDYRGLERLSKLITNRHWP